MDSYGYPQATFHEEALDQASFDMLRTIPETGEAADYEDLLASASLELDSYLSGHLAVADNIAYARPHVFAILVYRIHKRRQSSPDYEIPTAVKDDWAAARKWAETTGRKLLESEPRTNPVPASKAGAVYHDARSPQFGRDQTDGL